MNFFRDPFWGFGQFLLAAIDLFRSLKGQPTNEATSQQAREPRKKTTEITTEGRTFFLLVISTLAGSNLTVFLPRIYAPTISFDTDTLGIVIIVVCCLFLDLLFLFYKRILLGIFLSLQYCVACTFTVLFMMALKYGTATFSFFILLHDIRTGNATGVLILFLVIYALTFLLMFPAYLIYRRDYGIPQKAGKKPEDKSPTR